MKRTIAILLIAGIAGFCTVATAADAKDNWDKNCASCHGKDGKGQTTMGKKVGCKDLTDAKVQEALKDEEAIKSIKEGTKKDGKELMKPFAEKLTADEIKALVAHIRTFKK
jgi:cytochrome c553